MNRIIRFIRNILYSIPFGMKGAEKEMLSQRESSISNDVGIHEVIQKESLGEDLLKGEVTQQVEELRYRNYKVYDESKQYEYLGNGIAEKKEVLKSDKIDFFQENKEICVDILTELNRIDKSYGIDTYTLSIVYNDITRFKLEKYCKNFSLFENKDGKIEFEMYFSLYPDEYDKTTNMFINELKHLIDGKRSEFDNLNIVNFVTYKAINEDDLINYKLFNLKKVKAEKTDSSYKIKYISEHYERINLTDKFYCESMDKKYKNKEKKELVFNTDGRERERFCSRCGKKINVFDGDITEKTYGEPLCKDCVRKILDI